MEKYTDLSKYPIGSIHGVGKVKAQAYNRLGVESVRDLIYFFPRAYENRSHIYLLCEAPEGIKSATVLTVATAPRKHLIRKGMSLLKFRAFDESGVCEITYFNQDYLKDSFPIGSTFRFFGKIERVGKKYEMTSPVAEPYFEGKALPPFAPIYSLTDGLSQKQIASHVETALSLSDKLYDTMPEEVLRAHDLCDIDQAIRQLHRPTDIESISKAKRRLIFDEFFKFAAGMALSSKNKTREGTAYACHNTDVSPLLSLLPYQLTDGQAHAIEDISRDMQSNIPMSRIVIGDVGCGKTVVAASAMYIAVKNGGQAALMAPTEILATQHYADLSPLFDSLGIKCALLIGSLTPAKKAKIQAALATDDPNERIDIVIGTQALISEKVEFALPALTVVDEQHRFGVNQRATLSKKSRHTHMLVMSATPIPRSLALVMYGDLDVSRINEMPKGRQRVDTFLVDEGYRARLDAFIEKQVAEGSQVYIVCPAVEEKELEDDEIDLSGIPMSALDFMDKPKAPPLKAAVQYADELSLRLPDIRIGFVHGKLKPAEKDAVMNAFANGELDVLVSTTVIEVGVNVPNATLMIVENAERFGLSQLHQLRGRVGRGSKKSYCVLVSGTKSKNQLSENSRERLETMTRSYDGFSIAEEDLKQRGPGDFLALSTSREIRQSGDMYFKLADMCSDASVMTEAFAAAREFVDSNPTLEGHASLLCDIQRLFTLQADTVS